MRRLGLVAVLGILTGCGGGGAGEPEPLPSGVEPWFAEVAVERGVDVAHSSGHAERYLFPEIVCGGAALLDMEGDGDLDFYLVQSEGALVERATRGGNRLYENDGGARFRDVTAGSGADDRGFGMGAATGDVDGDGATDLYVSNLGRNALLANRGGGRFEDVTSTVGGGEELWSASAGFLDYDRDGDLDLWVVNYVLWSEAVERTCYAHPHGETYCGPRAYDAPAPDTLYRNDGSRLVEVSEAAGLLGSPGNGLGIATLDFDLDGWVDVFVANDATEDQMWANQGDGRFVDRGLELGCAADQEGLVKAGMGVGVIDQDDDGDEDLLVVNMEGEPDSFFRNERTYFTDRTAALGILGTSRAYNRFGVGFVDFDHDGWLDLYIANGNILHAQETAGPDPFIEPNLLFRGTSGGRMKEVEPRGGTWPELRHTSRGAAFGDLDNDGDVDLFVVNKDGPTYLLENRVGAERGGWVGLDVREVGGRPALDATVTLRLGQRVLTRRVRTASSYCSANDPRVHVGLGDEGGVTEVTVRWADGVEESFGALDAGSYHVLRRAR